MATGVVRLTATLDGNPHAAEARVEEYVKPTFYVEVIGETETVRPGRGRQGQGPRPPLRRRRPPPGARYEVFLYRTLLDSPAWVDDAGLGAQGSAVTYGTASTTEGKLSVPERLYSSLEARQQGYADDPWATAPDLRREGRGRGRDPGPGAGRRRRALPLALHPLGPRPRRPGHLRQRRRAPSSSRRSEVMGLHPAGRRWRWPAARHRSPSAPPPSPARPTAARRGRSPSCSARPTAPRSKLSEQARSPPVRTASGAGPCRRRRPEPWWRG